MNFLLLIPSLLALLFAGVAIYLFQSREKVKAQLLSAQTLLEGAKEQLSERADLRRQLDEAIAAKYDAQKQVDLANQKMTDLEVRMKDWESQREESLRTAKAAILEAGGQMSSKLLEDHKREQESAKKEQEARIQQTTKDLLEQVGTITQSVASLRDQTSDTQARMDTVWRSLTSPSAAGQLAEVGLENTLKNLGLEPGRDFMMQYHLPGHEQGSRLRPDAILFLPQDVVIVVDSKASKFVLELAEAEGTEQEAAALDKLKRTMNQHLKDLSSKDYSTAVLNAFKSEGHGSRIRMLLNVMYLPSESALETMREADRDFLDKAEKAGIILAGPTSLHGLFSMAKLQIANAKQTENYDVIIASIENLMESTGTVLSHADSIGTNIRRAADAFNKMASSVNRRLLPRMKQLSAMGVTPAKGKALPKPVMTYDVRRMDDAFALEAEDENELTELKQIEKAE